MITSVIDRKPCCSSGWFSFESQFTYDRQLIEFRYSQEPNNQVKLGIVGFNNVDGKEWYLVDTE